MISSPRHEGGVYRTPIEHVESFTVLEKVVVPETRGLGDVIRGAGVGFGGLLVASMILFVAEGGSWPEPLVVLFVLACIAVGFWYGYHQPLGTGRFRSRSRSTGLLSRVLDFWRLWRRMSR